MSGPEVHGGSYCQCDLEKKELRRWSYVDIDQVLALLFLHCMTFGMFFHLSEPQFPSL